MGVCIQNLYNIELHDVFLESVYCKRSKDLIVLWRILQRICLGFPLRQLQLPSRITNSRSSS